MLPTSQRFSFSKKLMITTEIINNSVLYLVSQFSLHPNPSVKNPTLSSHPELTPTTPPFKPGCGDEHQSINLFRLIFIWGKWAWILSQEKGDDVYVYDWKARRSLSGDLSLKNVDIRCRRPYSKILRYNIFAKSGLIFLTILYSPSAELLFPIIK